MLNVDSIIKYYNLLPHPEGGYYNESYKADTIYSINFEDGKNYQRSSSTAIYYLLTNKDISVFHRIKSDEIWHFYSGNTLIIYEIDKNGRLIEHKLGKNLEKNESFQIVIKAGNWFAAGLEDKKGYCLSGCTVSPGFEFADFEMAKKEELLKEYPRHSEIIKRFSKE